MLPTLKFGYICDFACNREMMFSREINNLFSYCLGHSSKNEKENQAGISPAEPGESSWVW